MTQKTCYKMDLKCCLFLVSISLSTCIASPIFENGRIRSNALLKRMMLRMAPTSLPTTTPPMTTLIGCYDNGKYYPPGAEIHRGHDTNNNWCYGKICDISGSVLYWDNFNCVSTTTPEPTTTPPTTTPPTTTPFGCYINGQYYAPGTDISHGEDRGSNWCYGMTCDSSGNVLNWDNFNCFPTTVTTIPTTIMADCPIELYGEYASEIIEGQNDDKTNNGAIPRKDQAADRYEDLTITPPLVEPQEDSAPSVREQTTQEQSVSNIFATPFKSQQMSEKHLKKVHVLLGDSNVVRLRVKDSSVRKIAISGQSLKTVDKLLSKVKIGETETADSVVLHLGTNDIKASKVPDAINSAQNAMSAVSKRFPGIPIAFSSIIPRRGKGDVYESVNKAARAVNASILDLCKTTVNYHFIDNDQVFWNDGTFRKSLYDARDPTGCHVSEEGAEELYSSFLDFFFQGESDELSDPTPSGLRKRGRGSSSTTPPSANRKVKQGRNET